MVPVEVWEEEEVVEEEWVGHQQQDPAENANVQVADIQCHIRWVYHAISRNVPSVEIK